MILAYSKFCRFRKRNEIGLKIPFDRRNEKRFCAISAKGPSVAACSLHVIAMSVIAVVPNQHLRESQWVFQLFDVCVIVVVVTFFLLMLRQCTVTNPFAERLHKKSLFCHQIIFTRNYLPYLPYIFQSVDALMCVCALLFGVF